LRRTAVTNSGVRALLRAHPGLQRLDLYYCVEALTDPSVLRLCPNMTELNLTGIHHVTDACLDILSQSCRELAELDLTHCGEVSTQGIKLLADRCSDIEGICQGQSSHMIRYQRQTTAFHRSRCFAYPYP
jgi:hypothetical protein